MKELTTEQKAQRYDEALDRTIRFLTIVGVSPNEEPIAAVKRMSEYIFPELKESDDEQMKALTNALSLAKNCGEESAFDLRTLHEQLKKLSEE